MYLSFQRLAVVFLSPSFHCFLAGRHSAFAISSPFDQQAGLCFDSACISRSWPGHPNEKEFSVPDGLIGANFQASDHSAMIATTVCGEHHYLTTVAAGSIDVGWVSHYSHLTRTFSLYTATVSNDELGKRSDMAEPSGCTKLRACLVQHRAHPLAVNLSRATPISLNFSTAFSPWLPGSEINGFHNSDHRTLESASQSASTASDQRQRRTHGHSVATASLFDDGVTAAVPRMKAQL